MNITNILNLFRAHYIENKKRLIRGCLIAFGITAFIFTIESSSGRILNGFTIPFLCILSGTFYQHSLKKSNAIHFFNLPVTACEKLIHAILVLIIVGIGIQPLLLAGAYAGQYLFQPIFFHDLFVNNLSLHFNIWEQSLMSWKEYLYLGAGVSAFLFGSIYFKKNAFWKTLGAGFGFLLGSALYSFLLFYIVFGNINEMQNDFSFNFVESPFLQNYHYIIPIALIAFFLSLIYLRLRETEV